MNKTEYYVYLSELNHYHHITEDDSKEIVKAAFAAGIQIIHIESNDYPDSLRSIENPPLVLYCLGDISLLKNYSIAVVGTRRASPYGKWVVSTLGKELANLGLTHVSGMAWGIDAAGHEAVISHGGKSIAVLGTGVDVCFPKSSLNIYESLKINGLVVSEYAPGTVGYPSNFPERNRIISGLANKIIVVEGALRSGSLITARLALEQGKDVYAVPGNINQPNSIGTNILIMDGATPIYDIGNLGQNLGLTGEIIKQNETNLSVVQKDILRKIKENGSLTIEELAVLLDLPINYLLSELTLLEIKGFVANKNGIISL